jgi:hypothetical protein
MNAKSKKKIKRRIKINYLKNKNIDWIYIVNKTIKPH